MKAEGIALECQVAEFGSEAYARGVDLRDRVLRTPLGRPSAREEGARDRVGAHFVALAENEVIGVMALFPDGRGVAVLRSMAVAPSYLRRGVGARLFAFAERWAQQDGVVAIEASARIDAVPFYEACGFRCEGEEYAAHGIPHKRVRKELARR